MVRSAQWLRMFHAVGRSPKRALDVEEKSAGLLTLERSRLSSQQSVRAALTALKVHADAAAERPLEQSWQHGDYKTDNLLVSGNRMFGIDAHVRSINAAVYDAASFANHLELTLYDPRAFRLLAAHRRRLGIQRVYWYTWLTRETSQSYPFDYAGLRHLQETRVRSKPALRVYRRTALSLL